MVNKNRDFFLSFIEIILNVFLLFEFLFFYNCAWYFSFILRFVFVAIFNTVVVIIVLAGYNDDDCFIWLVNSLMYPIYQIDFRPDQKIK